MESVDKSTKTSKNGTKYLILFIVVALIGLGLVLTGFLVNLSLKNAKAKYSAEWYIYLLEISGALIFLCSFGYLYTYLQMKLNLKKCQLNKCLL